MISRKEYERARAYTLKEFEKAGIAVTEAEKQSIEVADFGLGRLEETGLEILTYINTDRVCAKELVLFPHQTCPEHKHIDRPEMKGKEETFRCRKGEVYLYVEGEPAQKIRARIPKGVYTVFNEIILKEGEQYTLLPNTLHWFQAGAEGAIVSEFSTNSHDLSDIFTDPEVDRIPEVQE